MAYQLLWVILCQILYIYIYTYIYIYIYISSCYTVSMDFSDSLAIHLYHPLLLTGLLDFILCPYRVVGDKVLLVDQHLHVHMKGSIGEHHLWDRPYFSRSILYVLFFLFGWFKRWEVGGVQLLFCRMLLPGFVAFLAFLCSPRLAFSL